MDTSTPAAKKIDIQNDFIDNCATLFSIWPSCLVFRAQNVSYNKRK